MINCQKNQQTNKPTQPTNQPSQNKPHNMSKLQELHNQFLFNNRGGVQPQNIPLDIIGAGVNNVAAENKYSNANLSSNPNWKETQLPVPIEERELTTGALTGYTSEQQLVRENAVLKEDSAFLRGYGE